MGSDSLLVAFLTDRTVITLLLLTAALGLGGGAALIAAPPAPWRSWTRIVRAAARIQGWALGVTLLGVVLSLLPLVDPAWRVWVGIGGLSLSLALGMAVAGHDARRHRALQRALERQALDLARYLRIRVQTSVDGDLAILTDYVRRPARRRQAMQRLVRSALERHRRQGRGSVWDALHAEAEAHGVATVIEVTRALANVADRDRSQVAQVAEQMDRRLTRALLDEVQRRQQRAELVVTVVTAGTLFFGLIGLILFVMSGGFMVDRLLPPG
jgi:hypothetical protein